MSSDHVPTRDELVAQYEPLALRIARRYSPDGRPDPDICQVALLGLIEAAERFDPSKGGFASFAIPTINGTLKKHLRTTAWAVHVPRRVQENALTLTRVSDELRLVLHRAPTIAELHEATGISVEQIHAARRASNGRSRTNLAPEHAPVEEARTEVVELREAINSLAPEAQQLLELRFQEDLTQKEIASRLGISQPQVHRRLTAATQDLRDLLGTGTTDSLASSKNEPCCAR